MSHADSKLWLGLLLVAAALFFVGNRGAYKGYFQDDDLDNLNFTREIPGSDFYKYLLLPHYFDNNFRPTGHVFYRWMGLAAGLDFTRYVFAIHSLHFIDILLLWFIMRWLALSRMGAGMGALFFSFHMAAFDVYWKPMYVFDLLCCTFCLISLAFYIKDHWVASLAAFLIAYHAKEVAIMLPAVLAAYEFLLGQKRWKRLVPFLLLSAYICVQAYLANRQRGETAYTLHFDPASVWQCILFYSSYIFLIPYAGFLVLLWFWMYRDRRVLFGTLSFCLLLVPMLLLPGRLFSAYLYVPLAGLAIAFGAIATYQTPAIMALFFAVWLSWNYANMRWLRASALSDVPDRRNYVQGLAALSHAHPDILNFLYVSGPLKEYGARSVIQMLHAGRSIRFTTIQDADSRDVLRLEPLAVLNWNPPLHKLVYAVRTKDTAITSYIQMNPDMPLWQLETGWYGSEDHFRWTQPLATARLHRPAGATQFEIIVAVGDEYIQKLGTSHVTVLLNGTPAGEHDFTHAGVQAVQWNLGPALEGDVEVTFKTAPEFKAGKRVLGCAVVAFGFLPRQAATK